MECHIQDRRSGEFARALAAAELTAPPQEPAAPPVLQQLRGACRRVVSEGPVTVLALALAALALLLLLRPPFVLKFEQDQRRPWRGCTRLSWSSVAVAVALVALAPLLLRFVMARSAG